MSKTLGHVRYRFGFDIGGTFTDLVLSGSDGSVHSGKVLSDHGDVAAPIVQGLDAILKKQGIGVDQIDDVVAGATTAVTNLVIERKGARTALITTQGFRDVIEIGRELRYDIYDLGAEYPDPIVPRELRGELPERVDYRGEVLLAPRDEDIERIILDLKRQGARAIAVCLLHSFRNSAHEERVRIIANKVAPELSISLSSEVIAEIREYERVVATVLNAYVMPMVGDYLGQIEAGLKAFGVNATLQIMQSNGGVISREFGERMPIRMLESGPAAGALGAAHAAQRSGCADIVAFDMGGTTAKACLISGGEPEVTNEFEAARVRRFKKGSGLPVRLPVIDLIEIGAGGGSIASVDQTGLLKVGPRSAGSDPGPACYGLGGSEPTVTDAALVLGYLDPRGSLSGAVKLRPDLAEAAIKTHIADRLGISIVEAASGIHRVVCEHMASAVKIHAAEKGKDIRRYTLLGFGGAGPIHSREVARRSGVREIIIPANAGVFSAVGLLVAPVKVDMVRTRYSSLSSVDWDEIEALYAEMEQALNRDLEAAGVSHDRIKYRRRADMRYVGQGFEVSTEIPARLSLGCTADIVEHFQSAYHQQFGHRRDDQPIEVLNWRLEGFARVLLPGQVSAPSKVMSQKPSRRRQVFFPEINGFVDTPIFDLAQINSGVMRDGPALVEQAGSTIVIGPTDKFSMDQLGSIRVTLGQRQDLAAMERGAVA
jgi:N-methylhydantoinase A